METKFSDLNVWLKLAIIGGWLALFSFTIGFMYGFFGAL